MLHVLAPFTLKTDVSYLQSVLMWFVNCHCTEAPALKTPKTAILQPAGALCVHPGRLQKRGCDFGVVSSVHAIVVTAADAVKFKPLCRW